MDILILSKVLFKMFDELGFTPFKETYDNLVKKRMYTRQPNMVVKNIHVSDIYFNDTYFTITDNQVWRMSFAGRPNETGGGFLQLTDGCDFVVNILLTDGQLTIAKLYRDMQIHIPNGVLY